jgi:drug/metabolite transporter (DMT)-like permease
MAQRYLSCETRGYALGILGVTMFAATLPMTGIAVGTDAAPRMDAAFVTHGRAAGAALLSALWLWWARVPVPSAREMWWLLLTGAAVTVGFPLFMALAMRTTTGAHASVVLGVLPLATAALAAISHGQKIRLGFWASALMGSALVMMFAASESHGPVIGLSNGDWLLLGAVACAAIGYTCGAHLSKTHRAETVICWAVLLCAPVNIPLAWSHWPTQEIPTAAWWAMGYVTLFSMWLGFFAWYRGLALGGVVRVSQTQLLQPFLGILFSIPLLGEAWSWKAMAFASAVVACVFVGRRALQTP